MRTENAVINISKESNHGIIRKSSKSMIIVEKKLNDPMKFTSYGYIEDDNQNEKFLNIILDNELEVLKVTGFESDRTFLKVAKLKVKEKHDTLFTTYHFYHSESLYIWEKKNLIYINDLVYKHVFSKYFKPKPIRNRKFYNKKQNFCINGEDFACKLNLLTKTVAINQERNSIILHCDIDDPEGLTIAKDMRILFDADIQCIETSVCGHVHVTFMMSTYLTDDEIAYLQKYLNETFKVHIDVRRTSTVMRYWNSHSYRTGYFNDEGEFVEYITLADHAKWQETVINFNGKIIDLNCFAKLFLEGKMLEKFNKRNGILNGVQKAEENIPTINFKTNYSYNKNTNLSYIKKDRIIKDISKFYYGSGERHDRIFKDGLCFYAYNESRGDYYKFCEIILMYDLGSKGHKEDNVDEMLQGYWDFVNKNYIAKENYKSKISSYDSIFDNTNLLDETSKCYIRKLSDYIIEKEIKHEDSKKLWSRLYPKFLEIIISRELLKQQTGFKLKISGKITNHLKNQLEDNGFKFISSKEYSVIKKSYPELSKFYIRRAFELFIKHLCIVKKLSIDNSFNKKEISYIPNVRSTRYIFKINNTDNFIKDLIDNIQYLINNNENTK